MEKRQQVRNYGIELRFDNLLNLFLNSFKPQTRKYHLVSAEVQQKRGVADLEFDLQSDIASQLEDDVQQAFRDLVSL